MGNRTVRGVVQNGVLGQILELLLGVSKMAVVGLHNLWRGLQEGFLRGYSLDPALFGELLVAGKAESNEELHRSIGGGFRGRGFASGLSCALCFGGFFFARRRRVLGGNGAVELIEEPFVEAESLFPGFQLVTSELGFFFVGSKIKQEINVGHEFSLRLALRQVKRCADGYGATCTAGGCQVPEPGGRIEGGVSLGQYSLITR